MLDLRLQCIMRLVVLPCNIWQAQGWYKRSTHAFHPNTCSHTHIYVHYNHNAIIWHDVMKWNGTWIQKFPFNIHYAIFFHSCLFIIFFFFFFFILHCYFANINHLSSEIVRINIETVRLFHEPAMLKRDLMTAQCKSYSQFRGWCTGFQVVLKRCLWIFFIYIWTIFDLSSKNLFWRKRKKSLHQLLNLVIGYARYMVHVVNSFQKFETTNRRIVEEKSQIINLFLFFSNDIYIYIL